MKFTKMHGAGNDYVYLNCFEESLPDHVQKLAVQISDRHFGVGSDGLVCILPSSSADAEMRMWNADGSEAQMCGNALRCVAWFLRDRGMVSSDTVRIRSRRGEHIAEIVSRESVSGMVRVSMGRPILEASEIPTRLSGTPPLDVLLNIGDETHRVSGISMGNPHCVLFCDSVDTAPVHSLGPIIEDHTTFPERTNVGFAQIVERNQMQLRVWERGSGETLACGTGACAAVVAAVLTDRCDRDVRVRLPGGDLQVRWSANDQPVEVVGPVAEVFRGDWLE